MTKKSQMKGGSLDRNLKTKVAEFFDCLKNCDRKYEESTDSIFVRKIDRRYFNLKMTKIKISL